MSAARSEIITIELGGEAIAVELSRKRIKGMNLRVSASGEVKASAPLATPSFIVREFIKSRKKWLEGALARQRERERSALPPDDPRDGGKIRLHGEYLPIRVESAKMASVSLESGVLVVSARDREDAHSTAVAIERWKRAEAKRFLTELTAELLPRFAKHRVKMPTITIKRLKSRWGSCSVNKAHVNYNIRLLAAPEECARYVVAHELAHFVVPRHDRAFYAVVAEVIPDWKRCKQLLKAEPIE